jgi:flagella basal body P-ring formation protein FlgA
MRRNATENRRHVRPKLAPIVLCAALGALAGARASAQVGTYQPDNEPLVAIRAAAQAYVLQQLPRGVVADVSAGSLDARLRLAHCGRTLRAGLPPGAALQARSLIGVSCDEPVHWTVYVPVTVETRIQVLLLRHAVARESRLSPEDVTIETRKITGLGTAYLSQPAELSGRTLRRSLPAGTTLTADMFAADLLVHHGQDVTLLAASGGFEVRAMGRALQDAPAGARLKVQNLSSMKVVEGIAESADTVRVAQ